MSYILIKFSGLIIFCFLSTHLTKWKRRINESPIIVIDKLTAVRDVSDKFLSVALDTSLIRNGQISRIKSHKFLQRALPLAPAFLRIGGTSADRLIFAEDESQVDTELPVHDTYISQQELYDEHKKIDNFTMSESTWTSINKFSDKSGFQLVFDLNVLLRNEEKWDTSNALDLLLYSNRFKHDIVWQLGNEPNSFKHVFGTPVNASQLGYDFQDLRRLLKQFPKYKRSKIIGPDITRPHHLGEESIHYLKEFLFSVGNSTINAVTWHQYYLNGRTATFQDFINPNIFNILKEQITAVKEVVDKQLTDVPIWLSETSTAFGGGAPGLSNTFIAGFLWLDKLGLAARHGIDVVVRQSLYYGYYSLLDNHTLDPLPDWWLSVIYKKLVGTTVLNMEQFVNSSGPLRLYAHCSSEEELLSTRSVITFFGMNVLNTSFLFNVQMSTLLKSEAHISAYVLTGCESLTSRSTCLNGISLVLKPDGTLPHFKPAIQSLHSPISLPPYSLGFWTIHNINTNACAGNKYVAV